MITIIRNYTLKDIKDSMNYLLEKASLDEGVRQLGVSITHNKPDPIAAIYDWIKENVSYVPDPVRNGDNIELFTSPVKMVENYYQQKPLGEDCDGMALLAVALCRSIGIKSNVALLDTRGEGFDHAVANVYLDGKYIFVDPSSGYPLGWEINYARRLDA